MKFLIYNIVKTKLLKLFGTKIRKQSSTLLILLIILVIFSSVILIITIPPRPVNVLFFRHGIAISDNSGFSLVPKTTTAGDNVYVVWQSNKGHGISNIYFRASKDNGTTFGNIINLSHNTGLSSSPQIAAYNNNVYVVWQSSKAHGISNIDFRASKDNGTTFGNIINLSHNTGLSSSPQIAAYNNNVYVVWQSNATRNSEIYFEKIVNVNNNNNKSYFIQKNLSSNKTASSVSPNIIVLENYVYVIWRGSKAHGISNIDFRASKDNGTTFGNIINLSHNTGLSSSPQIAAYNNNVYVVWQSNATRNSEIYFEKIVNVNNNNNKSYFIQKNLSSNKTASSVSPNIIVLENYVYVIWRGSKAHGISNIYFRASKDNGTTFGNIINLSHNTGLSSSPQIAAYNNNVYVVWQSNKGHGISNIYFRASKDNGTTFGNIINLSHNTGLSSSPQIAAYNNNVYVVWQSNATRNNEIYFEKIVNVNNNNNKSY